MATKETDYQERRTQAIQRCVTALEHACQCSDVCHLPSCQKMKGFVAHAKTCKQNFSCDICMQLITLNGYHSKNCQETKCPLPFCSIIKLKLFKQQPMEQDQSLKSSIEAMQCSIAATQNLGSTESINQRNPDSSSNPTNQPSSHTKHLVPQSGMGMKASACPPVGALLADQQVQDDKLNSNGSAPGAKKIPQAMANTRTSASSAIQQKRIERSLQQVATFLKSPNVPQQKKQQAMRVLKAKPSLMSTFIKLISGQQNVQSCQPLGSRPQSQMMGANSNPSLSSPGEIPQDVSNPGTSAMHRRSNVQVLKLLTSFKSPNFQ